MRRQRITHRRQRGLALVEFALLTPLFLTMLLGLLEFGRYFYVAVSANNAAREGARQCTLVSLGACGNCNPSAAGAYMSKIGMGSMTSATATCDAGGGTLMYTVNVSVDFPTLTSAPLMMGVLPASGTPGHTVAYGTAVMRGQ